MNTYVDDSFGYWFSGFTDGEGYFGITLRGGSQTPVFEFRVELRGDDRGILEEVKKNIGFGYFLDIKRKNKNPTAYFKVFRNDDCLSLINFFDKYPLRSKKHRDYLIWKKAFEFKLSHKNDKDKNKIIAKYCKELQDVKRYK